MKRKVWGNFWIRLVFVIVLCMGIPCLSAHAEEEKTEKIRVGFYSEDGYHTINQYNYHTGYDYEYLMEIAKYTGWEYEFVEGTWLECITWLQSGEIDLLGGVEKNMQRLESMHFASMPSIYAGNCLLVDYDTSDYVYEDFASFDGMKIGTLRGSTLSDSLQDYSERNGFRYELVRYDTEGELKEALRDKEIDCIYLSDVRNLGEFKIIGRFGYTSLYYATCKEHSDLIEPLDDALKKIHTKDHYYESRLHDKYFTSPAQNALTMEEEAYIQQNKWVKVALVDGFPLICEYDEQAKEYQGIIIDALDKLSDKTGLKFDYYEMPKDVLPWEYLENKPNVIMAPFLVNSLVTYMEEIEMLDTVVQGRMVAVSRSGEAIDLGGPFTLTVPASMYGAQEQIMEMFPNVRIIQCESHQNGLDQVKSGTADMTLINEITGAHMLQSPYYNELSIFNTENILEDITLAMGRGSDPVLMSILNKGISSLSERDIRQLVVDNTAARSYEMTLDEWAYQNKYLLLLLLVVITGVVTSIFKGMQHRKREKEERAQILIAEERHKADLLYQEKMFRQANFDSLTGLYNKSYFIEKTQELLERNRSTIYAVIRINVEKFKLINEMFGHERGDMVLINIADKLRADIGKEGVYGKLYSDQFVICYPIGEEEIRQTLIQDVAYLECGGQNIRVQMNVGVYINHRHSTDVAQLMEYAQIAMQTEEKVERGRVHFYKDAYLDKLLKYQKITNEMEEALREGQFHVFLQPQFDQMEKTLVGAEALVRWFHPTEGRISPGAFIPVFEGNSFIAKLDYYICDQVCRLLAKWQKQGQMVPVSINLSKFDIQNPNLISDLKNMLETYSIPIEYLHLEITESAYAEKQGELIQVVEQLREMGFTIEMDDFGSEYSSLNMLKDVPVDVLKLDMRFLSGETHMDKGRIIVESVVKLAHSLGLPVIAEGVETERDANFLQSVDCRLVQGYLYGKPMPVEEFEELLMNSAIGNKEIDIRI